MSVLNKVNVISSIGYDCKICQKLSPESQESIAGVFSTYAHSWLTYGPDLFVVNNSDGVLQSYWTFGENLQDDLEITCAVELPLEGCAIPLLILGISSENVNLICFFNPNTRKILRTVDIIYPVRTICVIEDGTNEVYPLNDALTPTEGLIAVGCAEGTILLMDLCRSILCKAVNGDFRFYSTEENPSEVVYVSVNAVASGGLSQKIAESRKKKNCVSVILTDPSEEGVTALLYSVESAVLFVGTSSGSFHLWNMSSLSCLFKSPGTNRAIISLSLLEPCDDPRHSLYLWICFEEYAQVAMYCISFSSKFFVHGYGVYYQNFESAGLVYRFTLGMEVDMLAKRPICSQAVAKLVPKNLVRCISLPEAEGTHLRLFITAYEIFDKGQVSIRAVIFDLNQWYRDQMPEEGISACLDSIDLDSKSLWHLQIDPSSLTLYQCVRPQEQHFHPTAFDFQVWCIEEEGVRCLEKLGLQTQWLRNMSRMGSKALVEPTQVFLGALAAGLLPSFVDPPDPEANNEVEERSYVLTICLENRLIVVIEDCVKDWNNGGYTVKGCTIQFLLDWLWNLHKTYKANGNKICIPLFDQSGMKFDVSEKRSLQHCKSLLNTVQSVYTNIVNRFKNTIIINGVEEKLTAMSLVRLYFDCCLKLISVNLLPEPNELGRPSDSVAYHFDDINAYATKRRKEGPFLGDSLLGRTDAEKQWLEEGGTCLYPPPSIQSVLRFCLHPSPSIANKMSLLLYLFMDIVNSYTPIRSQPVLDKIKNFQHLMRISEVQYKIVAGCWYFDHSMFDEGVDLLFDPRVLCVDLSEDQHRGILHLLASEGQEKLALQYLRLKSPTLNLADDLRMELNLLLSNGLVNEAFLFQRKHPEMRETLLVEFFEGCIERKQLGQVFGLNLDFIEEAVLMKYLKSSGLKEKGDLQILLLLSKAKYTEAMFLNDKLNSTINGPKSKIETDTRDMIVRGITGSLNSISRYIANEMKTYRPPPSGSHPQPLSSLIKVRNGPDGPLFQTDGKVLLSAVAKSTRHLSDFVNSFESGHRRKREDKDIDFESENEPSRKRLKLLDSANDVHKMSSLSGKWVHPPCKPSSSQNRDVMELVGTPLVKKRGKRFSPQSRPSSILKGKTPEKSIITEDFGETPKKTIRFALPDNEIQITARKPLRENETTAPATTAEKYSKVDSEDESSTPVTEEPSESRGLGKLSARKPLHGSDNLNSSVAGLDSTSVIDNIKDRLRSSAKKKVLEDGVNWQEVAEASKPRVLFTQGVSKITSVTKSDKTPSSTPMSQVLLDITVTSAEKKYLDSPSRGEECSPVTEALFNTTLLPKVLFPAVNNDKEVKEKSPEEESSGHAAFLERYKQLRNKNIKSSNAVITPKERKEKRIRFKEEQSFNVICTKQTVETLKSSVSNSSSMIVIDKELPPKKESTCNQNILKENNDKSDNQLIQNENKVDLELSLNKSNDNILKENNDKSDNQLIQNKNKLELEIHLNKSNENVLKENNDNFDKQLPQNENKLESSINKEEPSNEVLLEETEVHSQDTQKESLLAESENISVNDDLNQDMENSLHENNPLLKDDVFSYKDIDEIVSEKVTEWSDLKSIGVEENPSVEEPIDNLQDGCDYKKPIETEISHDVISNDKTCLSKNELLNDNETLKKEEEILGDCQLDLTKTSAEEKSKESSSDIKTDCVEIIDIASSSEDDNEDKQSYDGSLTEEETEGMSGEFSEEIEEEMSEKEEDGSDNEGSLPEVSSISSDEDAVAKSDEDISANEVCEKSPENNANIDTKVEQTEGTPLIDLSDEEKSIHSSEEKKKKKKYSAKQVSNIETEESKTGESSQCKQGFEEEISDADVFGLKSDISDNKEEGNSEDDLWIGLNDNESTVSDNVKKSKQKRKDNDLSKTESSQKLEFQHNLSNPQEELPRHKKCNLKSLHSTRYSLRKSLSGPNQPNIIKDGIEHNSLYNANLDTKKKKSVTGMVGSETSVLHESADSEIPPVVLNPVSDALSEKEIVEDTGSVNIPREKLFAENEQVVDCILVEEPVIKGVTSFSVERPTTEHNSEESQPVSSPLIADNSPFKNEYSRHVKILENAEVDSELQEDFQSIERNWTQQIEEEMKQDSVILKIESDDRQWHNVDSNKITSKELSDPKLIDLCEPKGKPEVVSSLQTLQVEHIQNNILISEGSKNLSKSLEIGRKDFSVDGTSLSLGDNNMLKKDDICHFDKPECVLPDGEKKYEDDDLVSVTGIDTEIVVSCNQEFKSSESNASLETYESEVLAKSLNKQSVTSLKLSDKDGQNKENITILCSSEKPNDGYNSEVLHLNAEVDDKKITGDCHINISVDNNGIKTSLTILSSEESLVKHTDGALITVQEKHFSSEACSTNISSKENITNKDETLSTGNNVLFFPNEKCKLLGNDVSEINLISVVAESSKLSKNINECFNKSSESASENCDSLTSTQNTEKNMPDSESATSLIEIHENKYSKKGINDENKIIVISDEIVKPGSEVSKFSSEFEVQPSKLSISSEHGEESIGTDTLDKISPQTNRKDNKNDKEVSNVNLMHNINDIADKVETNDFISNSEVVVPISSQEKAEISKRKDVTEFKQENTHVEKRPEDKILSGSEVDNHHGTAIDNFSHSLSSDHSCQLSVDTGHGTVSNNILIEHGENVSETNPVVCESKVHEDEKVKEEYISLSVDKDVNPVTESLDCKLNKAKINDSFASDTLNDLTKDAIPNVSVSEENNSKICSEKTSVEKSFFFGKEDIETYIRSTKATFQIGSRTSLPEEDEPIDPMEVAMIEDEEKTLPHPSPEPDIDLTLHLSPEHFRKPKKIDQGMVTENSYLQQRARKLRRSSKKLLTDESCERTSKTKITVKSEVYISSTSSAEKGIKCISTQTSDGVLDEIDLSESEEELIDYAKISGPSRKSILKNKSTRKMRQSSEPPLISKEDLKRKSSIGLGKSDDFTQSNLDQPVRRSRRLSECISETNEPVKNQYEKELRIKSHRKSRCYSEEPDFHRISSYKDKESAGYSSSENDYDGKDKIPERRRSRRHSEEPEMRAVLNKNLEKRKVKSDSTNIDDKYISRRRSNRFSEESDLGNKYPDERSRHSKNPDYTKYSEETEIRGILKKNNRTNRKTSLSCEMINDLKHYEEDDSYQESKKMRSQSEEPELQAIPKKRYRQSRRSSSTYEKAADVHYQLEEIPLDNRKIHRHSEDIEIQGLKKKSSNKSRSSTLPEVDQSEGSRELRKHSEGEIQGILKKNRKDCRISDTETFKLKLLEDVPQERTKRSRRHSEEPETLKILKKRERRSSQSSDIDNESNLQEGVRRIRRHSEEPELRGILKRKSSTSRKSLYISETANDFKLKTEDDLPFESRNDDSDVKGILKKSKSNKRRNSNAIEADKDLLYHTKNQENYDEEYLEKNKNTMKNKRGVYVSGANDEKSNADDMAMMVTVADDKDDDNKEIESRSSAEQVSENKRSKRFSHLSHEEEHHSIKGSPAKVRRRSSSTVIAKEEPADIVSLPEGEIKNTRKSLRRTPDKKVLNAKIVEEKKKKFEPENSKFVPKRLDYSDDESPEIKKSRSLIDFPIKRNSRLPRPALEDIREEDEDLLKKNKKTLDDIHLEEMKKKATSKKKSVSKLVIGDSDADSDVATPELWKKDLIKEKRLTRVQQKTFLMNQQLTSVSEVESPSTSSPRRNVRKKAELTDSPLKTPTRSSLRLQKKPPSEAD